MIATPVNRNKLSRQFIYFFITLQNCNFAKNSQKYPDIWYRVDVINSECNKPNKNKVRNQVKVNENKCPFSVNHFEKQKVKLTI